MKKGLLLLLLMSTAFFVEAQSLKDALFSGKLKNQTGKVVKKGDDLNALADSARRADSMQKLMATVPTNDSIQVNATVTAADSSVTAQGRAGVIGDSAHITATNQGNVAGQGDDSAAAGVPDTAANTETDDAVKENKPAPKSNNVLIKEYIDTVASTLTREALSSKKVKKGIYYVTASYTIGTDGQVEFGDIFLSPENETLQRQIKSSLEAEAPRLSPVLTSSGTPRKVSRKYNFTLTKD